MRQEPVQPDMPEVDGHIPFAHQAAVISVMMPPLAIGLGIIANLVSRIHLAPALVISSLSVLLLGGGLLCAVIALSGIRTYGTNRLFGRGIAGLMLNGIFLLVLIVGIMRAT